MDKENVTGETTAWIAIEDIDTLPEPFELVPTGEYDGGDLIAGVMILDDSYIVYIQVPNLEYDCEVIIK